MKAIEVIMLGMLSVAMLKLPLLLYSAMKGHDEFSEMDHTIYIVIAMIASVITCITVILSALTFLGLSIPVPKQEILFSDIVDLEPEDEDGVVITMTDGRKYLVQNYEEEDNE